MVYEENNSTNDSYQVVIRDMTSSNSPPHYRGKNNMMTQNADIILEFTKHKNVFDLLKKRNKLGNILVDEKNKYMYCYVPKVGYVYFISIN